ncbi:MAG: threonine synthase [Acidobacteriia bacterium]|nr:threonine synthase [Terriglobia bacterium]
MNNVSHLECSSCGKHWAARKIYNLCPECKMPLLVRYDLKAAKEQLIREKLNSRRKDMWRYREVMPVVDDANIVSLGEGYTPLLPARKLGRVAGLENLMIKDESPNPTASFKARGMAAAISMAKELGIQKVVVPSAGNAASAMAAYAAQAGMEAHIFMPKDVPRANYVECTSFGARVTLVDGLISDCGRLVAERKDKEGWFDVSTLKEPYRIEGKKTMGYELAEQLDWRLPDWIVYPTGGGTGLIGMWKAFEEMEAMGWIDSKRPRMVTVQASGCAPIVKAFHEGATKATSWPDARTIAAGLRVPGAIGDFIMLDVLRKSGGTAVMVSDEELKAAVTDIGKHEGIFCAPEGAACWPAVRKLQSDGSIRPEDRVVMFNTGSGLKYLDVLGD